MVERLVCNEEAPVRFWLGPHNISMKSLFYKIVTPIRRFYWFVFRPKTKGAKGLIKNDQKLLMIRNTYGKMHWTFPGGGIKRNETAENAAIREVAEEVGIKMNRPIYLGSYYNERQYKRDTVSCYLGEVNSLEFNIDKNEIKEAAWFNIDKLPEPLAPAVNDVLSLYRSKFPA